MTKNEARRVVWERLMTTARADRDLGGWMHDEVERQRGSLTSANNASSDAPVKAYEADLERLDKACEDVADIIERMFVNPSNKSVNRAKRSKR